MHRARARPRPPLPATLFSQRAGVDSDNGGDAGACMHEMQLLGSLATRGFNCETPFWSIPAPTMADLSRILHPVALPKDEAFATLLGPDGYTDGSYRLEQYTKPEVGAPQKDRELKTTPRLSPGSCVQSSSDRARLLAPLPGADPLALWGPAVAVQTYVLTVVFRKKPIRFLAVSPPPRPRRTAKTPRPDRDVFPLRWGRGSASAACRACIKWSASVFSCPITVPRQPFIRFGASEEAKCSFFYSYSFVASAGPPLNLGGWSRAGPARSARRPPPRRAS